LPPSFRSALAPWRRPASALRVDVSTVPPAFRSALTFGETAVYESSEKNIPDPNEPLLPVEKLSKTGNMTINEAVALASALIGIAANIRLYGHLSSVMNARFDSVDRRFDSVDRRFESVERRLERIQYDTHNLDVRLTRLAR